MVPMKITHKIELEVSGLGAKIREARKKSKKPLTLLCYEAGITSSYWYTIEAETATSGVSLDTIRAIEKALGEDFGIQISL